MSHFFPQEGKNFSSFSAPAPTQSAPKSGYAAWKPLSMASPQVWNLHC